MPKVLEEELHLIKETESHILNMTELIESSEKKIRDEEKEILRVEKEILSKLKKKPIKTLARGGFTKKELHFLRSTFIRRLSRHKLIFTFIITSGVVLVWRGVWEITAELPILSSSLVALVLGFVILWAVQKYGEV